MKRVILSSDEPDLAHSDGVLEGTRNENPVLNLPRPGRVKTLFECALPKVAGFGRWSSFAIEFSRLSSYF